MRGPYAGRMARLHSPRSLDSAAGARRAGFVALVFVLAGTIAACSSDGGDGDLTPPDDASSPSSSAEAGGSETSETATTPPPTSAVTTTTTLPIPTPIELPTGVRELATGDGSTFWITVDNGTDGAVAVVEGEPLQYTSLIPVGFQPRGVAVAADGGVWVVDKGPLDAPSFDGGRVIRIDPESREITQAHDIKGINPEGIVIFGNEVWVGTEDQAVAVDMTSGAITEIPVPASVIDGATRLTAGPGSVWTVDTYFSRRVTRIDGTSKTVNGEPLEIQDAQTTDLAYADGSLWVTDRGTTDVDRSNTLLHRVNALENRLSTTIDIGMQGFAVAADANGVYVAANDNTAAPTASELISVDPATNEIVSRTQIRVPATDVLIDRSRVFVLNGDTLNAFRALPPSSS